jgi:hypothetical protein
MKAKTKLVALLCLVTFVMIMGCHRVTNKEKIQKIGICSSYNLLKVEQTEGINGSISGNFFSISGKISSEAQLKFYWGRKSGERIATTLPYSTFLFLIDSTKKYLPLNSYSAKVF